MYKEDYKEPIYTDLKPTHWASSTIEYLNTKELIKGYPNGTFKALRITYTSPKTMHWITLLLAELLKNESVNLICLLEGYCKKKVIASDYRNRSDFGFERIVFSYLDYLLYRDGYSFDGKEIISPLRDDWQFQFRSSIEHFYPQHPDATEAWDSEHLNCFGNLVLIV